MRQVWLTLALAIAVPARAAAQDASGEPTSEELAQAKQLYAEGNEHYDNGEYAAAIAHYRRAYKLSRAPGFLYNIAQAHRLAGQCAEAAEHYQQFIDLAGDVAKQTEAPQLLEQMQQCVAERASPEPDEGDTVGGRTPAQPDAPVLTDRGGSPLRYVGMGGAAAGVGLLIVSGVFALRARSAQQDIEGIDKMDWQLTHQETFENGQTAAFRAKVTGIAGLALAVAGGVLWYVGAADGGSDASSVRLSVGARSVRATWMF